MSSSSLVEIEFEVGGPCSGFISSSKLKLKLSLETTFSVGWVAGENWIKAISFSKLKLKMTLAKFQDTTYFLTVSVFTPKLVVSVKKM